MRSPPVSLTLKTCLAGGFPSMQPDLAVTCAVSSEVMAPGTKLNIAPSIKKRTTRILKKSGVEAKLWPNGEISFHLPKRTKLAPLVKGSNLPTNHSIWRWWSIAYGIGAAVQQAVLMGLSNVSNFDSSKKLPERNGLKGITSLGRRRVRNACYLLTKEAGKHRLTFSTVTIPNLCDEDMMKIHLEWHKVIDRYRLLLNRHLKRCGLNGEIIGVSEVQEKRYAKSGFPALHGHFVFVGALSRGGWVLSPGRHDDIWRKSIQSVLCGPVQSVSTACQLKRVEKTAEGYLAKYMSKGGAAIASIVDDGFGWALPRQWWSCSRSLSARMDREIRRFTEGVPWLIRTANEKNSKLWDYYSVVYIEGSEGEKIEVGAYGRLSERVNETIREFLGIQNPKNPVL